MINELRDAIYTRATGDSTLNTLLGGSSTVKGRFYYLQAPEKATKPYAVFFEITNIPDRDTANKFEKYPVQINVYKETTNPKDMADIEEALILRFDDCESSLSLASYNVIRIDRNFCKTISLDDKIKQTIYQATIELQKK